MHITGAIFLSAFLAVFFGGLSFHSIPSAWKVWLGLFLVTDSLTWISYACYVMAD